MIKIILISILLTSCTVTWPTVMQFTVTKVQPSGTGYNIYLRHYNTLYTTFAEHLPDSVKVGAKINIQPLRKIN